MWDETLLAWIEEFLSSRSQKVLVNGKDSKEAQVLSGVPQVEMHDEIFHFEIFKKIHENF